MSFCKKYFFLPQRMSLRNSIEQFLNVGRKIWPKLDVSLSAFLTLNSQCPMKLLLRTSVPHDCLDRDQRFSWCNVSLRLRTLSKRIHEQLSLASFSSVNLFRMMFTWPSIASSTFGSFDSSWGLKIWVSFFFLALCPRDAITNKNINSTILIFKHHSSLTLNRNKCASQVFQLMLRECSSSPELLLLPAFWNQRLSRNP